MDSTLYEQKLDQAAGLISQQPFDLWLIFVRETSLLEDPALPLIYPYGLTWDSALLITAAGDRIAILGRYDLENAERLGVFTELHGYDESIEPALLEALRALAPTAVGVNSSRSDPAADGLTAGMQDRLLEYLATAGVGRDQVLSAEDLVASLRGRKTPDELARIQAAVEITEALYSQVAAQIRTGVSERQLAAFLQARVEDEGLDYAWDPMANPIVNTGPTSAIGHAGPSDLQVEPGHLVHFDFGVRRDGFCSDLQRMWYVLGPDEVEPPSVVQSAWRGVRAALLAGAQALRPGAAGWEVDAAARQALVANGLPEYKHAFGHLIGRSAHDGATVLGPRWPRYGSTVERTVEAGNVFAIELGAKVEGHGLIYLEENVHLTQDGLEWLSTPQKELWLVKG